MLVLDTNVLSEPLRQIPNRKVYAHLDLHAGNLAASVVTLEELRYGASRLPRASDLWKRIEQEIIPLVTWIPIDLEIAVAAADLRANLSKKGKTAGTPDCLIGATALVNNCILVTRNTAHFRHMPGLQLENWFD